MLDIDFRVRLAFVNYWRCEPREHRILDGIDYPRLNLKELSARRFGLLEYSISTVNAGYVRAGCGSAASSNYVVFNVARVATKRTQRRDWGNW